MWRFSSWFFRFIFFIFYFFLPSRIPAQRHPLHLQSTAAVFGHLLRPSVNRLGPLRWVSGSPQLVPPESPGVRDRLIFSNCADRQDSATVAAKPFRERVLLAALLPRLWPSSWGTTNTRPRRDLGGDSRELPALARTTAISREVAWCHIPLGPELIFNYFLFPCMCSA